MSDYFDFESENKLFPDDENKSHRRDADILDGLDMGFQFNFLENKEHVTDNECFPGVYHNNFSIQNKKNLDLGNPFTQPTDFNSQSPVSQLSENERGYFILKNLKNLCNIKDSDIFTKSILNNFNDKSESINSKNYTKPNIQTQTHQYPKTEPSVIINQRIKNNNFYINSPIPNYCNENKYIGSQFNNIYNFKKMLADPSIPKNYLNRKISDCTATSNKNSNSKIPIFKTVKFPRKSSIKSEAFSQTSDLSSVKNSDVSSNNSKKEYKKAIKLIRNRLSAQKSRLKKKCYIQKIENELSKTKEALNYYKSLSENSNKNGLDEKIQELNTKQLELLNSSFNPKDNLDFLLNKEYNNMQEKVVIELYKSIVKSMTPIELKFLEKKVINVDSITNISTLDVFLENLIRNMIDIGELYGFELLGKDTSNFSIPIKVCVYLESLKKFSIYFREFLYSVRNMSTGI